MPILFLGTQLPESVSAEKVLDVRQKWAWLDDSSQPSGPPFDVDIEVYEVSHDGELSYYVQAIRDGRLLADAGFSGTDARATAIAQACSGWADFRC